MYVFVRVTSNPDFKFMPKFDLEYVSTVGLPTMDLDIPGLPPLTSPPLPPFPLPPSLSSGPHPLNQLGCLGSAVSSPVGSGAKPHPINDLVHIWAKKSSSGGNSFLCIFIRININFCTNTRLLSSRCSVSLRAKHSVGPGVKPQVTGLVGGRSPPEADHADHILQFDAEICSASVTWLSCAFGSFAEVCHGIY